MPMSFTRAEKCFDHTPSVPLISTLSSQPKNVTSCFTTVYGPNTVDCRGAASFSMTLRKALTSSSAKSICTKSSNRLVTERMKSPISFLSLKQKNK